jgi:hypothetical protein
VKSVGRSPALFGNPGDFMPLRGGWVGGGSPAACRCRRETRAKTRTRPAPSPPPAPDLPFFVPLHTHTHTHTRKTTQPLSIFLAPPGEKKSHSFQPPASPPLLDWGGRRRHTTTTTAGGRRAARQKPRRPAAATQLDANERGHKPPEPGRAGGGARGGAWGAARGIARPRAWWWGPSCSFSTSRRLPPRHTHPAGPALSPPAPPPPFPRPRPPPPPPRPNPISLDVLTGAKPPVPSSASHPPPVGEGADEPAPSLPFPPPFDPTPALFERGSLARPSPLPHAQPPGGRESARPSAPSLVDIGSPPAVPRHSTLVFSVPLPSHIHPHAPRSLSRRSRPRTPTQTPHLACSHPTLLFFLPLAPPPSPPPQERNPQGSHAAALGRGGALGCRKALSSLPPLPFPPLGPRRQERVTTHKTHRRERSRERTRARARPRERLFHWTDLKGPFRRKKTTHPTQPQGRHTHTHERETKRQKQNAAPDCAAPGGPSHPKKKHLTPHPLHLPNQTKPSRLDASARSPRYLCWSPVPPPPFSPPKNPMIVFFLEICTRFFFWHSYHADPIH